MTQERRHYLWFRHRDHLNHFRFLRSQEWLDHLGNGWVLWITRKSLAEVCRRYPEYEFREGKAS